MRQQAVAVETALGLVWCSDERPVGEVICVRGLRSSRVRTATGEVRIVSGQELVRRLRTEPRILEAGDVDYVARQLASAFGPYVKPPEASWRPYRETRSGSTRAGTQARRQRGKEPGAGPLSYRPCSTLPRPGGPITMASIATGILLLSDKAWAARTGVETRGNWDDDAGYPDGTLSVDGRADRRTSRLLARPVNGPMAWLLVRCCSSGLSVRVHSGLTDPRRTTQVTRKPS